VSPPHPPLDKKKKKCFPQIIFYKNLGAGRGAKIEQPKTKQRKKKKLDKKNCFCWNFWFGRVEKKYRKKRKLRGRGL